MNYSIKLNDSDTAFDLYVNGEYSRSESWIGQHLINIAHEHGIDVSRCQSESHMFAILKDHVSIELEEF